MFNWLFPATCPCSPPAKAWIEERLQWLTDEFDDHAFNGRPLVLPTPHFFPERYEPSPAGVRRLVDRLCDYMDVDPAAVELQFKADAGKLWLVNEGGDYLPHAAGTYHQEDGQYAITLDQSQLDEPLHLVGTIAHELAHAQLLGGNRVDSSIYDNELLTDLTVVFFGLGIFLANSPRHWSSQNKKWPRSRYVRPEYMNRPMFGYALAHLALFRGESNPAWAAHLHWNARPDFNQALRFLHKTADSAYKPKKLRQR